MPGRHHPARSLSLVIPAYDEAAAIALAVAEADAALSAMGRDYEILVVDDGSTDTTAAVALSAAAGRASVRVIRHAANRGYGAALRTGFEAARGEVVAFTDADCQFHLADLGPLAALAEEHDVAVGFRLARQDPWLRCLTSRGYNVLVRALLGTGVRDCDCALKVFRREALARLLPESAGFFVNAEMLARARQLGLSVAEAGVRHRPRLRGASSVSPRDIPRTLRALLPFWWSRVLFPGAGSEPAAAAPAAGAWLLILIAVAVLLFFARLGSPLQEPQEARYAEIPRQMLAEGRWLVPVLHGEPYLDKPPLLYWLVMGSYRLFGVHDWAARLVSSGSAFLTVLLVYGWVRRALGVRAGVLAALVLCLSARYVYLGRLLTMDGLLCLWVVAALAAAQQALRGPALHWGWWAASAGTCGLGLLTKGPVALALVIPPLLAYQALDVRAARLRLGPWLAYLAASLAVAAPWYVAVGTADPEFVGYFLWRHNVVRFVTPFDHEEPAWFYLPGLLLGMLPWTLALPGLGRFLGRRRLRAAKRRPAALGFVLLALAWCLLFFSLAGCKRATYILPALPLLAVAIGCYLDLALPRGDLVRALASRWGPASALARRATLLVLALGVAGSLAAVLTGLLRPTVGVPAALALAGGTVGLWRVRPALPWAASAAATFALLFAGVYALGPGYARRFALRGQVRPHAADGQDARLPVACYPRRWDSVSFYLRRGDVRAYTEEQRAELVMDLRARPETLLFVKSDRALHDLRRSLPASLEFVPRGRQGTLTVGLVRRRAEVSDTLFAGGP